MDTVRFYGRSTAMTLSNGREVKIGLSDDGEFWGLRFGVLDDPDESVCFALSAEALEAAEVCIQRLRRLASDGEVQRWVLRVATPSPSETGAGVRTMSPRDVQAPDEPEIQS